MYIVEFAYVLLPTEKIHTMCQSCHVGSTACVVVIDKNASNGTRSLIAANLGDSRAILGRNGTAVDLTQVRNSINLPFDTLR